MNQVLVTLVLSLGLINFAVAADKASAPAAKVSVAASAPAPKASAPTKKVCLDTKASQPKKVCKEVKKHEKLVGTKVPVTSK